MDPQHPETLLARDGLGHGKTEPVMAAKVLEPIYETTGEFPKLVDVLEVMVAHNEDALARGPRAPPPARAPGPPHGADAGRGGGPHTRGGRAPPPPPRAAPPGAGGPTGASA